DLELMPLQSADFYKTAERVVFKEYKCNCKKGWKGEDRFIVYKADQNGIAEVINNEVSNNNVEELIALASSFLTDKVVISGGHTWLIWTIVFLSAVKWK
ncbi:hypothetical protein LLE87_30630, partial [Paenibacillus polymyxa]|nr:hypothetical protein [Paenibacillus polymyxa]